MGSQKTQWSKLESVQPLPTAKGIYPLPSRFGTHASMVIEKNEELGLCLVQDEYGTYETPLNRIDNGCADPSRYAESRLGKLFAGKSEKVEKR